MEFIERIIRLEAHKEEHIPLFDQGEEIVFSTFECCYTTSNIMKLVCITEVYYKMHSVEYGVLCIYSSFTRIHKIWITIMSILICTRKIIDGNAI